jgi:hypothetical protein
VRPALLLSIVIATNTTPPRGQIGANYFDSLNQSQVWINLEPKNLDSGPNPIELNVTASFTGRNLSAAPSFVDLRVQGYCTMYPMQIRQPIFRIQADGTELVLNGEGGPLQISSGCSEENNTGQIIVAQIPFSMLRRIAGARVVDIHAFGFAHTRLLPSDLRALGSFITAVSGGVTVK